MNKEPAKVCKCPNCGYKKPAGRAPCYYQACPRCEHPMTEA